MGIEAKTLGPLVLAAMSLIGEYAQAIDYQAPTSRVQNECAKGCTDSLRVVMTELISGWKELEGIYTQLLSRTLDADSFDEEMFSRIAQLLSVTRALEVTLKAATPPQGLASEHMEFRRAVASTRSRLADLSGIYRQSTVIPHYVDTRIDFNGLKELADYTTAGMARIA